MDARHASNQQTLPTRSHNLFGRETPHHHLNGPNPFLPSAQSTPQLATSPFKIVHVGGYRVNDLRDGSGGNSGRGSPISGSHVLTVPSGSPHGSHGSNLLLPSGSGSSGSGGSRSTIAASVSSIGHAASTNFRTGSYATVDGGDVHGSPRLRNAGGLLGDSMPAVPQARMKLFLDGQGDGHGSPRSSSRRIYPAETLPFARVEGQGESQGSPRNSRRVYPAVEGPFGGRESPRGQRRLFPDEVDIRGSVRTVASFSRGELDVPGQIGSEEDKARRHSYEDRPVRRGSFDDKPFRPSPLGGDRTPPNPSPIHTPERRLSVNTPHILPSSPLAHQDGGESEDSSETDVRIASVIQSTQAIADAHNQAPVEPFTKTGTLSPTFSTEYLDTITPLQRIPDKFLDTQAYKQQSMYIDVDDFDQLAVRLGQMESCLSSESIAGTARTGSSGDVGRRGSLASSDSKEGHGTGGLGNVGWQAARERAARAAASAKAEAAAARDSVSTAESRGSKVGKDGKSTKRKSFWACLPFCR